MDEMFDAWKVLHIPAQPTVSPTVSLEGLQTLMDQATNLAQEGSLVTSRTGIPTTIRTSMDQDDLSNTDTLAGAVFMMEQLQATTSKTLMADKAEGSFAEVLQAYMDDVDKIFNKGVVVEIFGELQEV